ncbi:pkb-activating kinase-like protein [Puccinia graminis f. sp. tritici]|uniref:Pkb-activating kinase-like protein n=1 Tax=Puccinia graminis f. sp. tritici TaxID=56615 RepID=A0A5B0NDP0_PUCGR|nr:pkb-activating kinase-like protein [Puccinia graminis f. sp. tritici]
MNNNQNIRPLTTLNNNTNNTRPTLHSLQPINNNNNNNTQEQPLSASSLSAPEHYSNPSSSVSRASSARSTSSVQAVPFRIPTRLTTTTTTTTTTTSTATNTSNSPSNIDQLMITNVNDQLIQPLQNLSIHQPPSSTSTQTTSSTIDQQKNLPRPELPRNPSTSSTNNNSARKESKTSLSVGDILGEGSYSTVYHVKDKQVPDKEYALKVLDKRHIQKEKKTKYVAIERDTLKLTRPSSGLYSTIFDLPR